MLSLGDWVQVGDELKMVLADVYSDAAGTALVRISRWFVKTTRQAPRWLSLGLVAYSAWDNKQGYSTIPRCVYGCHPVPD